MSRTAGENSTRAVTFTRSPKCATRSVQTPGKDAPTQDLHALAGGSVPERDAPASARRLVDRVVPGGTQDDVLVAFAALFATTTVHLTR